MFHRFFAAWQLDGAAQQSLLQTPGIAEEQTEDRGMLIGCSV